MFTNTQLIRIHIGEMRVAVLIFQRYACESFISLFLAIRMFPMRICVVFSAKTLVGVLLAKTYGFVVKKAFNL